MATLAVLPVSLGCPPLQRPDAIVGLAALPGSFMYQIQGFLDFPERSLSCSVASAWKQSCAGVDQRVSALRVTADSVLLKKHSLCLSRLRSLRVLEISGVAEDRLVIRLAELLQSLSSLVCVGSPQLTDAGLMGLSQVLGPGSALREVDLTFCQNTTYGATIRLRKELPCLELVRRQPRCFDGRFVTPFGGSTVEAHTYYADASFSFTRHSQSRGYVRFLTQHENGFYTDSLQYSNFGEQHGLPAFCKYLYRPGVALRQCANLEQPGPHGSIRNVLVAQALSGFRAPEEWPPVPDDGVPLGESVFVTAGGLPLPRGLGMEEARDRGATGMVSRMEVIPLEASMPPLDGPLVNEIEEFQREMTAWASHYAPETLERMEAQLHRAFGGTFGPE